MEEASFGCWAYQAYSSGSSSRWSTGPLARLAQTGRVSWTHGVDTSRTVALENLCSSRSLALQIAAEPAWECSFRGLFAA